MELGRVESTTSSDRFSSRSRLTVRSSDTHNLWAPELVDGGHEHDLRLPETLTLSSDSEITRTPRGLPWRTALASPRVNDQDVFCCIAELMVLRGRAFTL